jgi:hypothetical protein
MGLLAFVQEFVPHPLAGEFRQEVTTWFRIMGGFAMFIGAYSLLHMHVSRIRRKQAGWAYSGFVFLGASVMIVAGIVDEVRESVQALPDPGAFSLFDWLYNYVQVPCGATIFSILAFFMASAAFRTFRARNVGAAVLLLAAIAVMFGRVPLSEWVGGKVLGRSSVFADIADWLMAKPNMAAKRGILMGMSLGAISQSLRILFGIERSYLGGGE